MIIAVCRYAVEYHRVTIIHGETGCGKSTQIPQYLFEARWAEGGRCIACTQPRQISTVSIAERVAEEMGEELGDCVGYSARFRHRSFERGRPPAVKYLTDQELLREISVNPMVSGSMS